MQILLFIAVEFQLIKLGYHPIFVCNKYICLLSLSCHQQHTNVRLFCNLSCTSLFGVPGSCCLGRAFQVTHQILQQSFLLLKLKLCFIFAQLQQETILLFTHRAVCTSPQSWAVCLACCVYKCCCNELGINHETFRQTFLFTG